MTDLDTHSLKLLSFIEQSVTEALADPASRPALLSEADGAFRVLRRMLHRQDQTKLTQVMLVSDIQLELAKHSADSPESNEKLRADLAEIMKSRMVFGVEDDGAA